MLNSPIKWVGGKSRLRKYILPLIPTHTCYVEPFGGAGWVLFGKVPSQVEVFNDIDQELTNFFRVIKNKPEQFIASFDLELVSRSEFERLAELDLSTSDDIERAHRFYYLIMAGWGGELNYPRFQTSITDGGHGNRLIGALKTLRDRIAPIHQRLSTVIIENLDWQACIQRYDREGVFMYLDPPYPNNGANYAHNMRDWQSHRRLAERLQGCSCQWILSSYDTPEVRDLYPHHGIVSISAFSGMKVSKNKPERTLNEEVLIMNFQPAAIPQTDKQQLPLNLGEME